mmetsp:Transcript_14600/g.31761  ORF Transcript_14600/g.31761 Transcript_14600/m.31761 type:complete len:98 (+) Transcript_14600:107-400(+)
MMSRPKSFSYCDLRRRMYVETRRITCIATNIDIFGQILVQMPSTPYEEITAVPGIGHSPLLSLSLPHGMDLPPNSLIMNAENPYLAIDSHEAHLSAG